MSLFLHLALYGIALFLGAGAAGIAVLKVHADRDGYPHAARFLASVLLLVLAIIAVLVLAAGDLR